MFVESKPAIKSGTILSLVPLFIPALDLLHQGLMELPAPYLPPAAQGAIVGLGTLLAIYKRITAKVSISGLFK